MAESITWLVAHNLGLLLILSRLHAAQQTSEMCRLILSLCIAFTIQTRYARACQYRYVIATERLYAKNQNLLQSRQFWQRFDNWQAALNQTRKT